MLEVKEYQFKDIMLGFYDGPHATPPPSDEGPMFLGIKNIKKDGGIDFSNIRHIAKKDFAKWTKRVVPSKNDIVFSYEATLHRYALIPEGFNGCLGRRMALIRVNLELVNPRYLFLYFNSPYWKAFIETIKISGATVDRISIIDFPNYKIELPDLKTQNKLVEILSTYDDLIENNNQRIQLLEEMASEIYKEWFVRLRFPGYENAVFRDKNGKKVDRESDRALPNGWKKEQLREHINFYRGKSYSSAELRDNEGLAMINLKNIQRQGGFRLDGLKYFEGKYNLNNEAYSGDIVMAVTDMTQEREIVGRVALVPDMGIEKFIISMDLIRIEPISLPKLYLYCFLRYSGISLQLKEFANGANVLHLTPSLIEFQKAVIPPAAICEKFEELIKPMLSEIDVLNNKNQVLQETRDLLLPRLISGKLSVEHLLNETYEPKEAIRTAAEPTAVYETKSIK